MGRAIIGATAIAALSGVAVGQEFDVVGGKTSVLLDLDLLEAAASLTLSGVGGGTEAPGELGDGSVAFGINARDAAALPTTFSYDAGLADFGGAIEHTGTVLFNDDSVVVGDFRIGFDGDRVSGDASGFFVESTTGIAAILFDLGSPGVLRVDGGGLIIEGNLLVSSEFSGFLNANALASGDLTGADVGDALVYAIPAPAGAAVLGGVGVVVARRRR